MAHKHGVSENNTKNIRTAFLLNFAFTIIEIVGGIMTNSVAIFSDAVHDLGDSLSLGLAWYFQKLSQKESDSNYSYGYKRYSVIGALINTIVLLIGCVFILSNTIPRLIHPEEVNPQGMIFLAALGIIVNGIAVFNLKKGSSLNERVVSLHLFEDVLGWVAVLIGAIIMLFWDVPIIDPILSILITTYILYNVFKNIQSAMNVILQKVPDNVSLSDIEAFLDKEVGIESYSDIHIWSLDGEYNIMTINVIPQKDVVDSSKLIADIHQRLYAFNIQHCTIELCQ